MATFRQASPDIPANPDATLAFWVSDARSKTLELIGDLSDEQLRGPQLRIVNPLLWEIGHVTWFQEKWVLRNAGGQAPLRADGDSLYDSAAIPHDSRWDLPLPPRAETLAYLASVRAKRLPRPHPSYRHSLPARLASWGRAIRDTFQWATLLP